MKSLSTPSKAMKIDAAQVEEILVNYCKARAKEAEPIGESVVELWQEISCYIRGGGKRLRPQLSLMMYTFYGGTDTEAVLPAACAWEILHASLLIHDDIIDRDTIRHGKLNISGKYLEKYTSLTKKDAEHYALSTALLAGDLLLSSAYDIVRGSNLNDTQKLIFHDYLHQATLTVGGGELVDTVSAIYPVDSVDPFSIAVHKTASYSFQFPMLSGAAIAGASDQELERLKDIGRHAGIAFQFKDDLLGVFGDSQKTGKSNRSDITEKKRTLLVQGALRTAPDAERLRNLYSSDEPLTDDETEEAYGIIAKSSAKQELENLVMTHTDSALKSVERLDIADEHKQLFSGLLSKLVGRNA